MASATLILSDTHFGRTSLNARGPEALRPLWAEADRVVMNGDTAEIHHPEHRVDAAKAVIRLMDLCETDGVELTLLSGNHDPYISDHRHLHLAGGRVFVTHGDVMHPAIAPWSPAAPRMRSAYRAAMRCLPVPERERLGEQLSAAQHASVAEWEPPCFSPQHSSLVQILRRPWSVLQILGYWTRFPRVAAEFTRTHAPEARFLVVGHTHRQGTWTIGDLVVINTGCFGFPGRPRAVRLEGSTLSVWPIRADGDVYRLGRRALASYDVPPPPPPADSDAPSAEKTRPGRVRPSAAAT